MTTTTALGADKATDELLAAHAAAVIAAHEHGESGGFYTDLLDAENAIRAAVAAVPASEPAAWRCFHCDETFTTTEAAALHFGTSLRQGSVCEIDAAQFREMEARVSACAEEDSDLHRQMYAMQNKHAIALVREEEKGYALGLKDAAVESKRMSDAPTNGRQDIDREKRHAIYVLRRIAALNPKNYSHNEGAVFIALEGLKVMKLSAPSEQSDQQLYDIAKRHMYDIGGSKAVNYLTFARELLESVATPLPAAPAPTEQTGQITDAAILSARAEGRAEALEILTGLDPENGIDAYTGWSNPVSPEDEGSAYWEVEKLRELFGVDDKLHNLFDRAESMYWEASGKSDDADRMMRMVKSAPHFKPLHDFLAKHEAWGLMHSLQREAKEDAARQAPTEAPTEQATFDRRWSLARDGFGLQRNDESGEYVAHDDAVAVIHAALTARQAPDSRDAWKWPEFKDWIDSNRERPLSPYGWAEMAFNAGRAKEKA